MCNGKYKCKCKIIQEVQGRSAGRGWPRRIERREEVGDREGDDVDERREESEIGKRNGRKMKLEKDCKRKIERRMALVRQW